MTRPLAALALFEVCPRQRVSRQMGAPKSMQATMVECLEVNEVVADDGAIVPLFGGPGAPLAAKRPLGKSAERHKVDAVTFVAPHGTPYTQARNHDFLTFRRGMECATCKHLLRI